MAEHTTITLQRVTGKSAGYPTLGTLTGPGLALATLEDSYIYTEATSGPETVPGYGFRWPWTRIKIPGVTAIPAGNYRIYLTFSPRFGRFLPLIINVPQYVGIRFHRGASAEHSEGCILVGRRIADNTRELLDSAAGEADLVAWMKANEARETWLTIENPK
jgi:hypothetical protein